MCLCEVDLKDTCLTLIDIGHGPMPENVLSF